MNQTKTQGNKILKVHQYEIQTIDYNKLCNMQCLHVSILFHK